MISLRSALLLPHQVKGSFRSFVETAFANTDLNVTEVKYRYAVAPEAFVLHSVAIKSDSELAALKARLDGAGYRTMDLSKIEAAQVHLRHMVGGRARSYMGSIPDEHILVVEFPERPGALRRFLDVMSPWNITLFHYRNSGAQTSSVMLGLQVRTREELDGWMVSGRCRRRMTRLLSFVGPCFQMIVAFLSILLPPDVCGRRVLLRGRQGVTGAGLCLQGHGRGDQGGIPGIHPVKALAVKLL